MTTAGLINKLKAILLWIVSIGWVAAQSATIGLPVVRINTVDGEEPTAEYIDAPEGAYGRGITNETKVPASMKIFAGNGSLVYESGEYSKKKSGLTIKLRGNTSVFLTGKSSYKLKLQKKADLLAPLIPRYGETYKDNDWILLKTMRNFDAFVGFMVCDIVGVPWTPKYAFVDVVINDEYRGLYMLMESLSRNESRVNISKDGYIIERDAYWWNEEVKFVTSTYNQKFTFKYPDDDDISMSKLSYIEDYVNALEQGVANGRYEDFIDVESLARWLLVHDFLGSMDNCGSNIFLAKNDDTEKSKLYMLTNWDFDSNYLQEGKWSNQHDDERIYVSLLFKSANRSFAETYKKLYDKFAPSLWDSLEVRFRQLKSTLGKQLELSCYSDSVRWNYGWSCSVKNTYNLAKRWFASREVWLKSVIENAYAVSYELNGGDFKNGGVYPDSINFLDNIEIPQPQKAGYVFTGWTSPFNIKPEKDFVLYGYRITGDVQLTANWLDEESAKWAAEMQCDDFVDVCELEVFNVKGKYLGRIGMDKAGLRSVPGLLKKAGYASGIYIIRRGSFNKVLRFRDN